MRHVWSILFVALAVCSPLLAQTVTPPPPQSARQALIEMFMAKDENDFAKHLPDDARKSLIHKGENPDTSVVLRISALGHQMMSEGEHIETFDVGPTILTFDENNGHEKVEVVVERDSLIGEENEIELSVHYYKDGQPQPLPVVPRLIFTLKQEKEIWRLTELTAAAHVPLTDADYLKGLRKQQDESNESAARRRVTVIGMTERNYSARHPDRGYTCTLGTLFAPDPGEETGYSYDPGQGNEEWSGYRFTLSGCDGNPASKYRVTAVPISTDAEVKMFCIDESGTLKSIAGTKSSACFSRGEVLNAGAQPTYNPD